MAWNHNARNRSAEVRQVNYHEDGPSNSSSGSSGGGNNQEPNKLFTVLAGGVVIFLLSSAGLSVVTEGFGMLKDTIETTSKAAEAVKNTTKSDKEMEEQQKKTDRERKTEARPTEVNNRSIQLSMDDLITEYLDDDLSSEDVAELLELINDQLVRNKGALQLESTLGPVNGLVLSDEEQFREEVLKKANTIEDGVTFLIWWEDPILIEYIDQDMEFIENCIHKYGDDIDRDMHLYIRWGGAGETVMIDDLQCANYVYYVNFFR